MYKLYYLVTEKDSGYYIGMTKCPLQTRLTQHKSRANTSSLLKVYTHMRKYGVDTYSIVLVDTFEEYGACCQAEIDAIYEALNRGDKLLNLSQGGEGGFFVQDIEAWKAKLSLARQGAKPALGMKHSKENKKLFKEVSNKYWETQDTYNIEEVMKYSFKEANEKLGISKTHYYRLKRRHNNEACTPID